MSAFTGIYLNVSDLSVQGKVFISLSAQRKGIDYANLLNVAHSYRDSIITANIGCLAELVFSVKV